jgi:predicted transposase YdaD
MAEVNNPHDKFFKRLFGDLPTMADFIRNYLPEEIVAAVRLDTLTLESESFLDPQLHGHFSDLLFRAQLMAGGEIYLYLLFEHKSTPDKWVSFQLLRYLVRFWERLFEQGCERLPAVIPIVFYHGEARWNVPQEFNALVETAGLAALQKYQPGCVYELRDMSARAGTEIKGSPRLRAGLALLRYIFSDDLGKRLPDIFRNLREMTKAHLLDFLESTLAYLSSAGKQVKEKELETAMQEAVRQYEELGDAPWAMAWKQRWKEEGLEEGRQEGRQKTLIKIALKHAQHLFPSVDEATLARIRALPVEALEEFVEAVLDFAALEDLQRWLADKSNQPASSLIQ